MYLSSSGAHPGLVAGNNTVVAANAPYDDGTAAAFEASNGEDAPAAAASSSSLLYTAPASASDIYAPPISREQELSQRQRMFDNSIMQPYKKEAEFVQLLLTIEGRTLSKELFSFLFDMFINTGLGKATETSVSAQLRNLDFFHIFFELIQKGNCDPRFQLALFKQLNRFIQSSTRLKIYCCQNAWLLRLLQMLPSIDDAAVLAELVSLIKVLGSHSISPHEMKAIFKLMNGENITFSVRDFSLLLDIMQHINGASVVSNFFDFSGQDSGLLLPTLDKAWLSGDGFSMCSWLRIESFDDPTGRPNYMPYWFAFFTEDQFGIEAFWIEQALTIQTRLSRTKRVGARTKFRFEPGRWYHVAITHVYHFIRSSEVAVFVDGALLVTMPLPYPKFDKPIKLSYIATNGELNGSSIRNQPFCGQMGTFFLFGEPISRAEDWAAMYSLGPNLTPTLDATGQVLVGKSDSIFIFDAKRKAKILLAYDPKAVFDEVKVLETASNDRSLYCTKLDGTREAKAHSLKESLRCSGGIKLLLPLFRQISNNGFGRSHDGYGSSVDPNMTLQVYGILEDLLSTNRLYQDQMSSSHGFQLIGYLLTNAGGPPHDCTGVTVHRLEKLAATVSNSEQLYCQFFLHVYANFEIWIHCDPAVQKELIEALLEHVRKRPQFFRDLVGVQRVLDTIRNYYWIIPSAEEGRVQIGDAPTKRNANPRPYISEADIRAIRMQLLLVATQMASDGFTSAEVKSILHYLEDSEIDKDNGVEILQILFAMLTNMSAPKKPSSTTGSDKTTAPAETILDHLAAFGGCVRFVALLKRENLSCRVWAIKVITKILQLSASNPRRRESFLRGEFLVGESLSSSSGGVGTMGNNWSVLKIAKQHLQTFPFSETMYYALLEMLLELPTSTSANPLEHLDEPTIRNPATLLIIFELLCAPGTPVALQLRILKDIVQLLHIADNRAHFLHQPYWQNWLLAILASNSSNSRSASERAIMKLVVELFMLLFHHTLHQASGWRAITDTQALLTYFSAQGFLNPVTFTRELNIAMLKTITYDATLRQRAMREMAVFTNLTKWLLFTEESLFLFENQAAELHSGDFSSDEHFLLGIHRRHDGMWLDFEFAQQLLDYLDSFVLCQIREAGADGTVDALQSSLIRLTLRLTLYTLYETDAFLNTDKIRERSNNLKNVEVVVDEYFPQPIAPRLREGLSIYLQGKIKQWNAEMSSVEKVFQKNIDRLRQIVRRLVTVEENMAKVMYILSFLFRAMKRSVETQGVGANHIFTVFKEILIVSRPKLPMSAETQCMHDEQFIEFFMHHLSFPGTGVADVELFRFFENGVQAVCSAERDYITHCLDNLQRNKDAMYGAITNEIASEQVAWTKYDDAYQALVRKFKSAEATRRQQMFVSQAQQHRKLSKLWNSICHALCHERGPWAADDALVNIIRWKLDSAEGPDRMRLRLKRNRHYRDYRGCVRGGLELLQQQQQQARPAIPEADLSIRIKSLSLSEQEEGDIPLDEEPSPKEEIVVSGEEKTIFRCACELISPMLVTHGTFELTSRAVYFIIDVEATSASSESRPSLANLAVHTKKEKSRRWALDSIKDVHTRRYLLRNSALEFFFADHTTAFFNYDRKTRNKVWKKLMYLQPPSLAPYHSTGSLATLTAIPSPAALLKRLNLTARWRRRELSNFEYLMALNTFAGRTYNDLTQYPVFPWVIADYVSRTLDFSNPATFRDLSKPVGALNEQRLAQFIERYNSFDDPVIPKFHYGSHYSNVGSVLFYLIRLEPFTSHFLTLQGGKFDHPDRMFMSIPQTWSNCLTNPSDVKELIPEFFYQPEFLTNSNDFVFGVRNGVEIKNDVELPPWASTSEEFVRLNREALESEYVSEHLHEWIDLIFGYKQRGQEAIDAHNVFFYLTYAGVVDIDSIEDEVQRSSIESQIINFGQTPLQLFTKPHPRRQALAEVMPMRTASSILTNGPTAAQYVRLLPYVGADFAPAPWPVSEIPCKSILSPIQFVQQLGDRVIMVAQDGTLANSQLLPKAKADTQGGVPLPFTFDLDKSLGGKYQKNLDIVFSDAVQNQSACYALTPDAKYLICCGSWDDSVIFYQLASGKAAARIKHHLDTVTALAIASPGGSIASGAPGTVGAGGASTAAAGGSGATADSIVLVTASLDCTLAIWDVTSSLISPSSSALDFLSARSWSRKKRKPFEMRASMHTHDGPVTCVAIDCDLDLVLSGSLDRSVVLHNLSYGEYIRSIYFPYPVDDVQLARDGRFLVYCSGNRMLYLHSINGTMLAQIRTTISRVHAIRLSSDGRYCAMAGTGDAIIIQDTAANLEVVHVFELSDPNDPVRSLAFIQSDHFLLAGTTSGRLFVFPFQPYLWRS